MHPVTLRVTSAQKAGRGASRAAFPRGAWERSCYQATGHSRFNASFTNNCAISIICTTASTCLRPEPSRCSAQSYAQTVADSSISLALLNAASVPRPGRTVKMRLGEVCERSSEWNDGGIWRNFFHAVSLHSVGAHHVRDQAEGWRAVRRLVDQGMETRQGPEPSRAQPAITRAQECRLRGTVRHSNPGDQA